MNHQTFVLRAREEISQRPEDRITAPIAGMLLRQDLSIDCHCHLMNKQNLIGNYWIMRFLGRTDTQTSSWDDVVDTLVNSQVDNHIDDLVGLLNSEDMAQVADIYRNHFLLSPNSLLTALMMDIQYGLPFNPPAQDFHSQVDELNQLTEIQGILPFLALDPRRIWEAGDNQLYHLFLQAFGEDGHFTGVKVYPSMGYLPSHPDLMGIFQICQEKGIPVTVHCGGTTVKTFQKWILLKGQPYARDWRILPIGPDYPRWRNRLVGRSRKRKAEFLNHPLHWKPVLEAYPDLRLNLGHIGGNEHWLNYSHTGKDKRLEQIQGLMEEYPKVYGDIAGLPLDARCLDSFLNNNDFPLLRERALYGTDFWVNLSSGVMKESLERYKNTDQALRLRFEQENPKKFLFNMT